MLVDKQIKKHPLPYEIGFSGEMFTIPSCDGGATFGACTELSLTIYPVESPYIPSKEKMDQGKWGTYRLFRNWTIKEWFTILPFERSIEEHAFTEHQILYLIDFGLPFLPKENALFITKNGFLTTISRSIGGRYISSAEEKYYISYDRIDADYHAFLGEKAVLFFLM